VTGCELPYPKAAFPQLKVFDRVVGENGGTPSTLQRAQFAPEHLPALAMPPHEAVRQMVRNNVEYMPVDQAFGRVATTLFVVYPPGIATIVPGERLDERTRPMLDYLKMFERSANLFPGFEAEIQGIYREIENDGTTRFYTYVVRE